MRLGPKQAIVALVLCGLAPGSSSQQVRRSESSRKGNPTTESNVRAGQALVSSRTFTPDDGLAVIAAALDSRIHLGPKPDCSHLVHAIYGRAGFPYRYVPSSDLYVGTSEFQRVVHPQAGDLVVWRGHAGIVVNPAQRVFFSAMHSGLGIDTYDAPYWNERGRVRFYRYIKSSLAKSRERFITTPSR